MKAHENTPLLPCDPLEEITAEQEVTGMLY